MEEQHFLRKDNWLLGIAIILTVIGILMIFSTSSINGEGMLFKKQLAWFFLGLLSIFFILKKNLSWWNKYSIVFFLAFLLLLFLTLAIPCEKGAKRWILGIQPSEFLRVFYIFYLSKFFSKDANVDFIKAIIPPCIVLSPIVPILVSQPHRGMAIFFCILSFFVFILAGIKKRHIVILSLIFFIIIRIIIGSGSYSTKRFKNWLYKEGERWQVEQAKIALGSGGIFGVGLGKSMQKLSCVPISYSDFIFAIIGEELGFCFGTIILFVLFAFFAYLGFSIACYSSTSFGFFLAFSLTLSIFLQAMTNIAVVSDIIPPTGLSLPFISYGGSSLISNFISVGFIIKVAKEG